MKKILSTLVLCIGITTLMTAQTNERTIGLRAGYGGELSYQHPLNDNRLEVNLGLNGFGNGDFAITGIYQWLFDVNEIDIYAGLGAQTGSYYWADKEKHTLGLSLATQVGVQYNFDFPLQLSLDWRPTWTVLPAGRDIGYYGLGLGVRYRF